MIDSHCHLNFKNLSNRIDEVVNNCIDNKISSILSINTNPLEFDDHLKLINNYKGIYISYGFHPCEITDNKQLQNLNFDKYCIYEKVIAIGETGIDLYHSKNFITEQINLFKFHIEASIKHKLPLIIHQRNSEQEIIQILEEYRNENLHLVFHSFTGSEKLLDYCIQNNYYISLSGIITFKNAIKLREIIRNMPLDLLLIETDSPFLSPIPVRGTINEPSNVSYTASYLSEFFEIDLNDFEEIIDSNFFKLFTKAIKDNHI